MNVRERAKTFEAFISGSGGPNSSETERKRSQDENMMESSGATTSNGQKDSTGEKHKPVPPPRKARKKIPTKPDSPQLQHKTTPVKSSPEIHRKQPPQKPAPPKIPHDVHQKQSSEKPKAPRKPPPPRRGSYSKLPSPSLKSHIPHAKTKEFTPNNDAGNSVANDSDSSKELPQPQSRETSGTAPRAHSRVPPSKPSRGSPRNSQNLTSSETTKISSCEIKLSKDPQKDVSDETQRSPKVNPKRPPPPVRTSSLTRKSRPPVPPKPKRPHRPATGPAERKSATIPRTGSVESKEAAAGDFSKEGDESKNLEKKARSLSSPLIVKEDKQTEPRVDGDQSIKNETKEMIDEKNMCESTSELKNVQSVETQQVNGIDESKSYDIATAEIVCKDATSEIHRDKVISNGTDEPIISSKDDKTEENINSLKVENLEANNEKMIMKEKDESVVCLDDDRSNEIESGIGEKLEADLENTKLEKKLCHEGDILIVDDNAKESSEVFSSCSETQADSSKTTEEIDLVATSSKIDREMEDTEITTDVREPMETDPYTELNKELELDNEDKLEKIDSDHHIVTESSEKVVEGASKVENEWTEVEEVTRMDANKVESEQTEVEEGTGVGATKVESKRTELELEVTEISVGSREQEKENTSVDIAESCPNEDDLIHEVKGDVEEEESKQELEDDSLKAKDVILSEALEQPTQPESAALEVSSEPVDVPSGISEVSVVPESVLEEEKQTEDKEEDKEAKYLETSLDEEFFKDEEDEAENVISDQQPEDFTDKVVDDQEITNDNVLEQPYETDIDAVAEEKPCLELQDDSKTDSENIRVAETDQECEDLSQVKTAERSPETAGCYENIEIVQAEKEREDVNEDESTEPVRPSRRSRQKKQSQNAYENATVIQSQAVQGDQVESSTPETKSPKRADAYENTTVVQAQAMKGDQVEASTPDTKSPKRADVYENAVIINQTLSSQEDDREDIKQDEQEVSKPYVGENETPPRPRYENVVFAHEVEPEDDSVYEVPRRNSFHSDSPTSSLVRSARSASVGSMERKKGGGPTVLKQTSKTQTEYVVPKSVSTALESEDTYAAPRSIRAASTEETYVAPRAIRTPSDTEDVYVAPRSIRTISTEESVYVAPRTVRTSESDETYVVPRSITTSSPVDPEDTLYVAPKSISSTLSETAPISESEYHVPARVSPPQTEEENGVYSVPTKRDSAVKDEEALDGEARLRRATRSSVLTSRDQLPSSLKSAPAKPPRSSLEDSSQQSEDAKPTPIPRTSLAEHKQTPEQAPRASPRPKPRQIPDKITSEKLEKSESEQAVALDSCDQSTASPKPKRPAPPRPKAPSIVLAAEKEAGENCSEVKQKEPPRRPPPPLNRVSVLSAELEGSPSSPDTVESSSDSEDDQPPTPSGPPKKKTYHIAHEILSTERTFVKALTLCYEDCYGLIREADVVSESTLNDIFKDLGNIYHLDLKFLQELEERMQTWEETERIGDIVKKYGHFLKMYTTYINHYDKAVNVLQETMKENLQFAELVQQFQASDKCRNLSLETFMLKPVQRIPSYRLLLKDYLKHLAPDSEEYRDTKVALDIVSEVATNINESMKKVDNLERVLRIQESIVGNAEIVKPGREFIKEGTLLKLCRKDMQERTFFLLTDVLLYTSAVGGGQYKLKGTLPLLGIKVTLPDSPEFENEFSIISKTRSFTLSASTPAERDEWIEELSKAVSALTKKKSTFMKSKDGTVLTPEDEDEVWQLGDKAPVWIQDTRVTMCLLCTDKFTVTNRRHHCRACGKVVCGSCSDNLAPLAYLDYAPARVCDVCYEVLLKGKIMLCYLSHRYALMYPHLQS